jgi:hypothetical protein
MWCANRLADVIGVLERAYYRFSGVATEAFSAIWADDGRESFRFNRRKGSNDNVFDPIGIATRTAAVSGLLPHHGLGVL